MDQFKCLYLSLEVNQQLMWRRFCQIAFDKTKQQITEQEVNHVKNILKLLVRENININNLNVKKDRVNKIVATYTKYKPLTETKQREVIKGVLKGLYKK